ncbi:MAG: hypothetical protein NTX44_01610 [Ignavibacteriales bacterium]|nr:hypothetical protein [Ignavibacteriales bacterium]
MSNQALPPNKMADKQARLIQKEEKIYRLLVVKVKYFEWRKPRKN